MSTFWKTEASGQTVLPDRSFFKGRKSVENSKIEKSGIENTKLCPKTQISEKLKVWILEQKSNNFGEFFSAKNRKTDSVSEQKLIKMPKTV